THDQFGNPASGLFIQINSGSGTGGAPHRSHLTASSEGQIWASAEFDPGPMGDGVWHTMKMGRRGAIGYCELRNRQTQELVASVEIAVEPDANYEFFHISSIQGISNNWWVDFEIDNLKLSAAYVLGDLNCDGALNGFDIDSFILAVDDMAAYEQEFPNCDHSLADVNRDGVVNGFDIDAFLELLQ
ncbi:MAG: hypothetical protein KKB50_06485, partial [Planctomycetes bacterium]|nr:hypothetical protein [Planctomycetota bacterium]